MGTLTKLYNALRFVGLPSVLRSMLYSSRRDVWEKRYPPGIDSATAPLGGLEKAEVSACEGWFHFASQTLHVHFLDRDVLRFTWQNSPLPVPYAIAKSEWDAVKVEGRSTSGGGWILFSPTVSVEVTASGGVRVQDGHKRVLFQAEPPTFCSQSWTQPLTFQADEHIYGLGERSAPLNRRGRTYRMWNEDPGGSYIDGDDPLYVNIPAFIGLHNQGSYLVFFENSYEGEYDFRENGRVTHTGGALRYYLICANPVEALQKYVDLTGKPPLPPRWALGYHQSRWGYKTEQDIRELLKSFQQHNLPISAVHLDIDYMDGYRLFTVDKTRFPDLHRLTQDLAKDDVHLVPIIDAGIKVDPHYALFNDGKAKNVYCKLPDGKTAHAPVWPGWCAFPDFTSPSARQWWGDQYQVLLDMEVSGIWHDMNEPAAFSSWGKPSLPACVRHDMDGRGGDHRQAHNLYGLLVNRAAFEGMRRLRPEKRPWMVTRSGWAGIGRYAWKWTGDVNGTWQMLRRTVSILLGLSLSGVYFTGSDIGGFSAHPSPELYTRWFQMAAFTPFFRTHSATGLPRREPWQFDERVLNATRAALELRYRLLPYFYTAAWQAAEHALPLVRPLFFEDADNQALWDVDDAFLLGDSLLVAPILDEGAQRRCVPLPGGAWYELHDDTLHGGGQSVEVDASLEYIPVFVKAGAVIPMDVEGALHLHLYAAVEAPQSTDFVSYLYSDSGDGYAGHRVDEICLTREADALELGWQSQGDYPWQYTGIEIHLHGFQAQQAFVDGKTIPFIGNSFSLPAPFQTARFT